MDKLVINCLSHTNLRYLVQNDVNFCFLKNVLKWNVKSKMSQKYVTDGCQGVKLSKSGNDNLAL